MWESNATALKFAPEDGMSVIARVTVSLYERDGTFQVYVSDLLPVGEGVVAAATRQRMQKLEKLGIFDPERKKPIPAYPMRIGVATSETGAAIGDITQVLSRRWPAAKVIFCPALVQGEGAPESLVKALKTLDGQCDVIIIGRGGGSSEDLWAFQDEALALAIYHAETPIISAVGHEMDMSVCDMAADLRAPTPSAAAELATPAIEQIMLALDRKRDEMHACAGRLLYSQAWRLSSIESSPTMKDPVHVIKNKRKRLDFHNDILYNIQKAYFDEKSRELLVQSALLDSLSPLKILARGYAAVFSQGQLMRSSQEISSGDKIDIRFTDGQVSAVVEADLR